MFKKNTGNVNTRVQNLLMIKHRYFQNVLYAAIKNQDLLKNKQTK